MALSDILSECCDKLERELEYYTTGLGKGWYDENTLERVKYLTEELDKVRAKLDTIPDDDN